MSAMPPSGSRSVPTRARKSSSGVSGGLGAAIRAGVQDVNKPSSKEEKPRKAPQVRIAKSTYSSLLATRILKAVGIGFLAFLLVYVSFAVTIVRVLPTSSVGLLPVKNITFPGGIVPAGETVAVDMAQPQGAELTDYLKQSFVPNGNVAVVEVAAGPWGKFGWNSGTVTFKEQILGMAMPNQPEKLTLDNQYLVKCISGACVPGQGYVIPASHLMGQPL